MNDKVKLIKDDETGKMIMVKEGKVTTTNIGNVYTYGERKDLFKGNRVGYHYWTGQGKAAIAIDAVVTGRYKVQTDGHVETFYYEVEFTKEARIEITGWWFWRKEIHHEQCKATDFIFGNKIRLASTSTIYEILDDPNS